MAGRLFPTGWLALVVPFRTARRIENTRCRHTDRSSRLVAAPAVSSSRRSHRSLANTWLARWMLPLGRVTLSVGSELPVGSRGTQRQRVDSRACQTESTYFPVEPR